MKTIEGSITSPKGYVGAGIKAGLKKSGKEDLALLVSEKTASVGAVFTQNKMAAAPVIVSRRVVEKGLARALIVNAGCANACTGQQGLIDAQTMVRMTAELVKVPDEQVLVCSTGVIGQYLPMGKVADGIKVVHAALAKENGEDVALAIQTTDTFIKKSCYELTLGGKTVTVAGIAKGAGMIQPNMATMLGFVTTDAAVSPAVLQTATKQVADDSFNLVVVDGDSSTNDTFLVLANGMAENSLIDSVDHPDYPAFYEALLTVAQDLAKLIAHDGEGATKFLEVKVTGALSREEAKCAAMAIAKSPLVKTAFFGEDPNWGRIVCAAGYSGAALDAEKVSLSIGDIAVVQNGMGAKADEDALRKVMEQHDVMMEINLAVGDASISVWTCDLSYEYVKINGEYHT